MSCLTFPYLTVVQPTGPPVNVVTVMDILTTIDTPTVVMKVDVESFECRVSEFENLFL